MDELNSEELTYRQQILQILTLERKGFRKNLAVRLGIKHVNNINRDINKLVAQGLIKREKMGRDVLYIALITLRKLSEIQGSPKVTWADKILNILTSEKRWFSCRELRKRTGLEWKNFGRYMNPMLSDGAVERMKVGRNTFYRFTGTSGGI